MLTTNFGRYRRILLAMLYCMSIMGGMLYGAGDAKAYACVGHCYGINTWNTATIDGAISQIEVEHMSCSGCTTTQFVDNEQWLTTSNGVYWVEAGYTTYSSTSTQYFWVDYRPYDQQHGHPANQHYLGSVPSGDYYGYVGIIIDLNGYQSYHVSLLAPSKTYSGTSTTNSMTPTSVLIGQELSGTSGASAQTAYFTNNGYFDASNISHYFTWNGSLESDSPPHAGWNVLPSQSSTGGSLYTYCC